MNKNRFTKSIVLIGLILAGVLGNIFGLHLFIDEFFYFGSIFSLIILYTYGMKIGIISTIVINAYFLIGYLNIEIAAIYLIEILIVGYFVIYKNKNMLEMILLTRLFLFLPLVGASFLIVEEINYSILISMIIIESINSIFNGIIASLVIEKVRLNKKEHEMSFDEHIFQRIVLIVLIPTIMFMFVIGKMEIKSFERQVNRDLTDLMNELEITYDIWESSKTKPLETIANELIGEELTPSDELQKKLKLIFNATGGYKDLYIADKSAETIAYYPSVNENNESTIGLNFSYRFYYQKMLHSKEKVVSDLFSGKGATNQPIAIIGVPVIDNDEFIGYVAAAMDLEYIEGLINIVGNNDMVEISLLDRYNRVIATTKEDINALDDYYEKQKNIIDFDNKYNYYNLLENYNATEFSKSIFLREKIINSNGWHYVAEVPSSYYIDNATQKYLIALVEMILLLFLVSFLCIGVIRKNIDPIIKLSKLSKTLPEKIEKDEDIEWPVGKIKEVKNLIECYAIVTEKIKENMQTIKSNNIKFETLAHYDSLTGLPNFNYLEKTFNKDKKEKLFKNIAIIKIDIDNFSNINNTLGYSNGDLLIKDVAERIVNLFSSSKHVFRETEDEFIIMMDYINGNEIHSFLSKLKEILDEPFVVNGIQLYCTFSMGVSKYPNNGDDIQALTVAADVALYNAKKVGKNTIVFYDEKILDELSKKIKLEEKLRKALINNELEVVYQPIVNANKLKLEGAEALVRWHHPIDGTIFPSDFIPVAEETGLIIDIGDYVLKQACQQITAWNRANNENYSISVNVSVNQFYDKRFIGSLKKIIKETGVDPKLVYLEVTENIASRNIEYLKDVIVEIKKVGVKISIDDFGVEYSSLNYLKTLAVDKIKIDKVFIDNINNDTFDSTLVKAVIEIGHSINYKIVAEGVEDKLQFEKLKTLNCDEIQGYFFSKPVSKAAFETLIKNKTFKI